MKKMSKTGRLVTYGVVAVLAAALLALVVVRLTGSQAQRLASAKRPADCGVVSIKIDGQLKTVDTCKQPVVTDSLAKKVLADGKVSAEELSAVKSRFVSCLTAQGFSGVTVGNDGRDSYKYPDSMSQSQADAVYNKCYGSEGTSWGEVLNVYMRAHPDRSSLDLTVKMNQYMVSCLVRVGLASTTYTVKDYVNDLTGKTTAPYSQQDPKFDSCSQEALMKAQEAQNGGK